MTGRHPIIISKEEWTRTTGHKAPINLTPDMIGKVVRDRIGRIHVLARVDKELYYATKDGGMEINFWSNGFRASFEIYPDTLPQDGDIMEVVSIEEYPELYI